MRKIEGCLPQERRDRGQGLMGSSLGIVIEGGFLGFVSSNWNLLLSFSCLSIYISAHLNQDIHLLRELEKGEKEMNMKVRINTEKQNAGGGNPKFFYPEITTVDILVCKCEPHFPCWLSPLLAHFQWTYGILTVATKP